MFQFYDSPIKSLSTIYQKNLPLRFQFYDSPIKRLNLFVDKYQFENSFNSMIVRLKESSEARPYSVAHEFQFYDSPIKS